MFLHIGSKPLYIKTAVKCLMVLSGEGTIVVRRHVRRRSGKVAELARKLGLEPVVVIEPFVRRRYIGPKHKKNEKDRGEDKKLKQSKPSRDDDSE